MSGATQAAKKITRTPVPMGPSVSMREALQTKLFAQFGQMPLDGSLPLAGPKTPTTGLGALLGSDPFTITEETITRHADGSERADPDWAEMTLSMCKASPAFLAQEMLSGPPEAPYNGRFMINEHHEDWDYLATHYDRVCVLASRDHGKTFFWNYAYVIWKIINHPGRLGFIFSATQPQASRILADIKNELESNPRLQWLVPTRKDFKWTDSHIKLTNGHEIYARGFGTKVRGAHPVWIVVDDGLNDETMYSETVRTKQNDYFYTAITNMIVPGGQIVVVGTPFHMQDLYSQLEENPEYEFRRYPALNKAGEPLWPERYSLERLLRRQVEIGNVRFSREFLCVPVSDDMSLFPGWLFVGDPIEQPTIKLGMPGEYWDALGVTRYMGVDFAMSSSVQADFTVVWVMGLDVAGNRWIVDIQRAKGMPYQQQLSLITAVARKYDPGLIFLESNQMQRIFGDELIRTTDLPIKKFITGVQKNSLEKGVPSLRVLLENKKFRIPRGDARSIELTDQWIAEMRSFTWHEGKLQSVGGHDDLVMGCWICDQAIRQGGFGFSFGGEDEFDGSLDDTLEELTHMADEQPLDFGEFGLDAFDLADTAEGVDAGAQLIDDGGEGSGHWELPPKFRV